MAPSQEFGIQLFYDKRPDGRYHIHSPNIPGLHVAGSDLDEIKVDVEPLVIDLLFHNSGIVVDTIQWVPSLEDMVSHMKNSPATAKEKILVITGRAA